jgi:PPOX class probable F420-dependent enzyme
MPRPPVPLELDEFLRRPNPCVIATIRPDGELHTAATWYEWSGDGTVLVNMAASRLRLEHMRKDPRVALTMLDGDNWYTHVSLIGRVREIRPDPDLADINRIAVLYTGNPYRDQKRDSWTAVIEVTRWHGWRGGVDLTREH